MHPQEPSRRWRTLTVRVSVFPVNPWEAPASLWTDVVGELPDTEQSQPKEHARVQTGQWHGGTLQLTAAPLVTVWTASAPATEDGLPNLENWAADQIIPAFQKLTHKWLASADFEIKRIGFGVNAVIPAVDRTSAHTILQDFLWGVKLEAETTSDFLYQINRPTQSQNPETKMSYNRLTKWTAPLFQARRFAVPAIQGTVQASSQMLGWQQYAGLEIDANTPAEREDPLDRRLVGTIYDELVELALRNLEFGELGEGR